MSFKKSVKEHSKWHEWFAYHPVKLTNKKWAFFKKVLRRGVLYPEIPHIKFWEYQEKMGETTFIKSKESERN